MDNKINVIKDEIKQKLANTTDLVDLDKIRVAYLGKKGSITALLKGMKELSNEERKSFGAEVNQLKAETAKKLKSELPSLKKKRLNVKSRQCLSLI